MIKLIILDIDGVLTNGRKIYDSSGKCVYKEFCDKDWTAIKRFQSLDIQVVFLTGDPNINGSMGLNRGIKTYVNRSNNTHIDKAYYLEEIMLNHNVEAENICYVGDDLFDIGIMKKVKYPFCVEDSPKIVKDYSRALDRRGGDNVIARLFETLEDLNLIKICKYEEIMDKIYELDKKQVF